MNCPYCGHGYSDVVASSFRSGDTYRERECRCCKKRYSTQERPLSWSQRERKWPGRPASRKDWRRQRMPALCTNCEIEACGTDFKQSRRRRHVDHIVPARLIQRLKLGNPHVRDNLQCICGTCHGYKLKADHKLCMGDKLGYMEILRTHHFDMDRVGRALSLYGL
jgi:hypothetical protein